MSRELPMLGLLVALALSLGEVSAKAADDPQPFVTRVYPVGALTASVPEYRLERGPIPGIVGETDEVRPLFLQEGPERWRSYGSIDDVIELLKSAGSPADFSAEGMSIAAIGPRQILLRAAPALHARIAAQIAEHERRLLALITLDVLALRGDASSAKDGGLAAAITRGALVPLSGARASACPGASAAARVGADVAYVGEEAIVGSDTSKARDPAVQIAKSGLAFTASSLAITDGKVSCKLHAWWGAADAPRRVDASSGGACVETLVNEGRGMDAVITLAPGDWSVTSSGGGVVFAVRATVRLHDTQAASPAPSPSGSASAAAGPVTDHAIDVRDLATTAEESHGQPPFLWPSSYVLPTPPEMDEPAPAFPSDALVETIRQVVDPPYWATEGVSLEFKSGTLLLRADEAHARRVTELLDTFRASIRLTRVRTTMLSIPLASIPEYLTGLDDGATLLADGGKSLLARPGAEVLERATLLCRPGQRVASVGGKTHSYVGDYDVEVVKDTAIGRAVTRSTLEGLSFDAECMPASEGAAASIELQLDRSTWGASREVPTPYGALECPRLGISRLRGHAVLPLGGHRIVGATLDGGTVTLTIVSASAD